MVAHIVTFVFYCVVLPATVLVPEVEVPKWGAVYIPSIITILNAVGTPRSVLFLLTFHLAMNCYIFSFHVMILFQILLRRAMLLGVFKNAPKIVHFWMIQHVCDSIFEANNII